MLRRALSSLLAAVVVAALLAPAAGADEPLKQGLDGSFALKATNGYKLSAMIGSTGEGDAGLLILSVAKKGSGATYLAHGEVTKEHVHFDLGSLGLIDLAVQRSGRKETVQRLPAANRCAAEGLEYTGTIEFHGEEGFTEASATRAPLNLKPILDIVCPGPAEGGTLEPERRRRPTGSASQRRGRSWASPQKRPGAPRLLLRLGRRTRGVAAGRTARRRRPRRRVVPRRPVPRHRDRHRHRLVERQGRLLYCADRKPASAPAAPGAAISRSTSPAAPDVPIAGPGFKASLTHPFRTN